jgi:hypothetical protein
MRNTFCFTAFVCWCDSWRKNWSCGMNLCPGSFHKMAVMGREVWKNAKCLKWASMYGTGISMHVATTWRVLKKHVEIVSNEEKVTDRECSRITKGKTK